MSDNAEGAVIAFESMFEANSIQYHVKRSISNEAMIYSDRCGYTVIVYNQTLIVNDSIISPAHKIGPSIKTLFAGVIENLTVNEATIIWNKIFDCYVQKKPSLVRQKIAEHATVLYEVWSPF